MSPALESFLSTKTKQKEKNGGKLLKQHLKTNKQKTDLTVIKYFSNLAR